MRDLIEAARSYYIERDSAMAEVERLLSLDEEELDETMIDPDPRPGSRRAGGDRHENVMKRA